MMMLSSKLARVLTSRVPRSASTLCASLLLASVMVHVLTTHDLVTSPSQNNHIKVSAGLSAEDMNELNRIISVFEKHKSAKVGEFTDVYPPLFQHFTLVEKQHKFCLLEIGNRRGESLRTYLELFPNGEIYGLDIGGGEYDASKTRDIGSQHKNAHLYVGDQADVSLLVEIGNKAVRDNQGFDFINDDGGHMMSQQITSLKHLWKFVKPGGYYVIEDIETSYYNDYGGGELNKPGTFMALLKDLADVLQRDFHDGPNKPRRGTGTYSKFDGDDEIFSIQFYTNACIIRKAISAQWPKEVLKP